MRIGGGGSPLNDHLQQKEGGSHGSGRNNAAKGRSVGLPAGGNIIGNGSTSILKMKGCVIMKLRKRILSFALAVILTIAMAIPVSATVIIRDHQWSGFSYSTSDKCLNYSFNCLIESTSAEYTLRTDVEVYTYMPGEPNPYYRTYTGNTGTYLAQNQQSSIYYLIGHIRCLHYVGNTFASVEWIEP